MIARNPYVSIPKIYLKGGKSVVNGALVLARLQDIQREQTEIALRRGNPVWIPAAGEIGYLSWREYHSSNHIQLPYPGTRLAQPDWFDVDVAGFNDLEEWCYLRFEEVQLMQAVNKRLSEDDLAWIKQSE